MLVERSIYEQAVATAAEALASPTGRAIVRFADVPTPAQLRALRGLGLSVRGLDALPMAVVHGPAATLARIVPEGLGLDVRADEVLSRIGLSEKADSYPSALSGGQQQRVGIGRAMAMDAELLLFDEPTSALDPEWVGEVLDLIRSIADGRQTMLIVTHEMQFAREIADRVVFMENGRIVEQGPPARIFDAPTDDRTRAFLRRVG